MDAREIWNEILSVLEVELSAHSYDAWIRTLEPVDISENRLILMAPSEGGRVFVNSRFRPLIINTLNKVNSLLSDVLIIQPEVGETYKDLNEGETAPLPQEEAIIEPSLLNQRYNFENFVVGKSNQFVHAAAEAVAEEPGIRYNPLVIYGSTGLGKTHIMHAVGNAIKATQPSLKILYVSSDKFVSEFIDSIRTTKGKSTNFRDRYRNVDVLMVDDIQFIGGKQATQEEMFHTFNELYNANKQLIFSSDRPLKEIDGLEDRLRSRFEWGLTADIQPPDLETRIAILQKKAQIQKYNISSDILSFMAEECGETNIREMEGLLNKVIFLSKLEEKKPSIDLVKEALSGIEEKTETNITVDDIIAAVCQKFGVAREDLEGKKRNREIVEPRQICIYMITELMDLPYTTIGNILGGRDHTTVIHSKEKIFEKMQTNNKLKTQINDLRDLIFCK